MFLNGHFPEPPQFRNIPCSKRGISRIFSGSGLGQPNNLDQAGQTGHFLHSADRFEHVISTRDHSLAGRTKNKINWFHFQGAHRPNGRG